MDPISSNFSNMICCYAYGTDGPYKCCGSDFDQNSLLFLLLLLPIPIILILGIIYCCRESVNKNHQTPGQINKNQPNPGSLISDTSIQLETITLETVMAGSGSSDTLED